MLQIPLYKRVLSYITPVTVHKTSSADNPVLEVLLYKDELQLATEDAIYSDGSRYRPLAAAFEKIKFFLPNVRTVLMLGTGLGSGVQILNKKGCRPAFTLIEKDPEILALAKEVLGQYKYRYTAICADAEAYMQDHDKKYDLLVVDVFTDQEVPGFVTTNGFLQKCLRSINSGGKFVLNYISADTEEWNSVLKGIGTVFPNYEILSFGINRIIIATA